MYPKVNDFHSTEEERERALIRMKYIEGDYIKNIILRTQGTVTAEQAKEDFYKWIFLRVLGFEWRDLRAGSSEKIRKPLSFDEVLSDSKRRSRPGSR